jgi:hypothetical protein
MQADDILCFPMRYFLLLLVALLAAPPAAGQFDPTRGDVRFVVISDLNSAYGTTDYESRVDSTIARIPTLWRPDAVLISGDMIAGQKRDLPDSVVAAMWTTFDERVAAPLYHAGIPLGFSLGNHDGSGHPGHERDREMAHAYWTSRVETLGLQFVDQANFPFAYTFEVGGIFVLAWDATTSQVPDLDWVEASLASESARQAPVRIVIGHLPLYAVAEGRNRRGEVLENPAGLRALLERHAVDLYISGHHHAFYPGRRGDLQLLHTGALGQGQRPLIGNEEQMPPTFTVLDIDLETSEFRYATFEAETFKLVDEHTLPLFLEGINGFVVRRDARSGDRYEGGVAHGVVIEVQIEEQHVTVSAALPDAAPGMRVYLGSDEGLRIPLTLRGEGREASVDQRVEVSADFLDGLIAGRAHVLIVDAGREVFVPLVAKSAPR